MQSCEAFKVEQGDFGDIEISRILMQKKHPVIKKDVAYCGAGLVEGVGIGKFILRSESFDSMNCPESAGDVHPHVGNVAPDSIECLRVSFLAS